MLATKLLPHQSACIDRLLDIHHGEQDGCGSGAVVSLLWGSGKTLTSIEAGLAIRNQRSRHERVPLLVLTDVSTVEDWGRNATEHYSPPLSWIFVSGKARVGTSAAAMNWHTLQDKDVIVTNVEILAGFYESTRRRRMQLIEKVISDKNVSRERKAILERFMANGGHLLHNKIPDEELAQMEVCTPTTDARCALFYVQWPVIIVDEAHKVRNSSSVWFSVLAQLKGDFRISLTATPFNNSISDVVSVLAISNVVPASRRERRLFDFPLDEWTDVSRTCQRTFCKDFKEARDRYIIQGKNEMVVDREHYRPVDIILRIPFDTETEREHYNQTSVHAKESTLTSAVRLKQSCSGIYDQCPGVVVSPLLKDLVPTKVRAVLQYVEMVSARNEKVNIMCEFRTSLIQLKHHIHARFAGRVGIYTVDGETSARDRQIIRAAYERHRGAAVLIVTSVFNQGVNLHCANHTILFSTQWNPVVSDQGRSRCERPAQTKSVFSVQIIIADTIEDQIWTVAAAKRKTNFEVMSGEITPELLSRVDEQDEEKATLEEQLSKLDDGALVFVDKAMRESCTHFIESIDRIMTDVPPTVRISSITTARSTTMKRMTHVNVVVQGSVVKRRL